MYGSHGETITSLPISIPLSTVQPNKLPVSIPLASVVLPSRAERVVSTGWATAGAGAGGRPCPGHRMPVDCEGAAAPRPRAGGVRG